MERRAETDRLAGLGVVRVTAHNPGPMTLTGSNSWLLGDDQPVLVDPGPDLPEHAAAVALALDQRGGPSAIVLTHAHADHAGALDELRARYPAAPVYAAATRLGARPLADEQRIGPLRAVATAGHSADHFAFVGAGVCFTGDAVLGEGSVFVAPGENSLARYLAALARIAEIPELAVICPGHGPAVFEPRAKLLEYIDHRLARERRLVAALDAGLRTTDDLLDSAWSDAPAVLRPAAAVTLAAHLEKLDGEARLPDGVERQQFELGDW
jgi:glyoxylase-like metal-dependent hydrolase (beta-lactamase superfamily II)